MINFDWQPKAYQAWADHKYYGTIKGTTGSGKTHLGIVAVKQFKEAVISVPTIDLMYQWVKELIKNGIPESKIGKCGDDNEPDGEPVIVGVINSLRERKFTQKLCILDEVHLHTFSDKNRQLLDNNNFKYVLGLSATPEKTISELPIVFDYDIPESTKNGTTSEYKLRFVNVDLNDSEKADYAKFTKKIVDYRKGRNNDRYWSSVKRRKLLANIHDKIYATKDLVEKHKDEKMIIFCEFTEPADYLHNKVLAPLKLNTSVYHTNSGNTWDDVKDSDVIITARKLNVGIDIPEIKICIIVGWNKQTTDAVQRIGRVLRKYKNKTAKIYVMVGKNTNEEKEVARVYKPLIEATEDIKNMKFV